jgi:hypothetical protein
MNAHHPQARADEHVSALTLDRLYAGEPTGEALERIDAHLRECARCRARRAQLHAQYAAFLEQAPTLDDHGVLVPPAVRDVARANVRADKLRQRFAARSVLSWACAAVAAAGVCVLVWRAPEPSTSDTRSKGSGPQLGLFIKHGARVQRGADHDVVHAGDVLRFSYSSPKAAYLAIFERDAVDTTVQYPSGAHAARIQAGNDVAFDFGVELDDGPSDETIYGVFCPRPFELEPIRTRLQSASDLQLDPACSTYVLHLRKTIP